MTTQILRAQTTAESDLELPFVLCISLLGLTLSLALLPLFGPELATLLAFVG